MSERTPKDFPIEHAEYMARDAENLLEAIAALDLAEQRLEMGEDVMGEINEARETLSEKISGMRSGIYEFRKRRDRALATPGAEDAPVWPVHRLIRFPVTEAMHAAAVKVLIRAHGVDGLPQRLLEAMLAAMPPVKQNKLEEWARVPDAVWEALQRMIEDGLAKGPNSQDDARTIARWRARFIPDRDGVSSPRPDLNLDPNDRARALMIATEAQKHLSGNRTHLTKLIYVSDLVWALGVLTERGDGESPQQWIDDPHDIEGGQMLNPAWLRARNLTPQEAQKAPHVTQREGGPDFTVPDPDLDELLNNAATMVRALVGERANMDDGLHFLSSLKKIQERLEVAGEVPRLRAGLTALIRGYVNLMEAGRDRILDLGGQCDPLDVMERSDTNLREAREAFGLKSEQPT